MRSAGEFRLNGIWYGGEPAPWWLHALTPLYRAAHEFDRWWNTRRRPDDLGPAFIIVVGNITAGGSGKTPLVIRICEILKTAGYRPGVVSRGYGRKVRGLRLATPASDPDVVGDEPLLIAQRTGVPVIVAPDRCEAVRTLLKKEVDVVVSDDGLQHYRLPRDVEICVIDGSRGFGSGRLIPAGPLREPLERLGAFDYLVVNGEPDAVPAELETIPMLLTSGILRSMDRGQNWRLAQFGGCKVNAVAGVGNPGRFFALLEHAGIKTIEHVFPDHHAFSASDFERMDRSLPILMTEKDAVKCRPLGLDNAWYLSVDALLPSEWEHELLQRVHAGRGAGS